MVYILNSGVYYANSNIRQEKLQQIRDGVKNKNMKLLSQEESDHEIELFFQKLEK